MSSIAKNPHILVVPFPGQGHINPAVAFSRYLASKGVSITIILTSKSIKVSPCSSIAVDIVSDGLEESAEKPKSIGAYFTRLKTVFANNLRSYLDKKPINYYKLIIYDAEMPWFLDVAHERGLLGASFFTQACGVCAINYHLKQGTLRSFLEEVSLPCLPKLLPRDLPNVASFRDADQTILKHYADQFSNLEEVDWIFINTFDKLEKEIVEWMASQWPIKTVGPTFLLQQPTYNHDHMINLLEPNHDACKEWLDSKETGSVIYVSLGSNVSLGKEEMEELANGLIMSNCCFLWVLRASAMQMLPQDFTSSALEKRCLIVEWCHQLQVLAHPALACFVSHCGWNSTLEALASGVPLIAMSFRADQTTNAKFVEDVWGVGVRVKPREDGLVSRQEIAMCIQKVTRGDKGVELKINACKWKELANEAVQKGGTSTNNIHDFVSTLL